MTIQYSIHIPGNNYPPPPPHPCLLSIWLGGLELLSRNSFDSFMRHSQTGHLVHVAVTIFDSNGHPVINLGLVNPWMCEASLVLSKGQKQRYKLFDACYQHNLIN